MGRLLISTPAYDPRVCIETYQAMLSMDMCGLDVTCDTPIGFGIVDARTKSAEVAVNGYDWILYVDSDIVPPKDALANLLSHGKDVCFGYYTKGSRDDGRTCLFEAGRNAYDSYILKDELHELRDDGTYLLEVRGSGFGFALIRTGVFGKIGEPWFEYVWNRRGRKLSEDYSFCTKCRNAGIKLYTDTRVDCMHVKQVLR